MNKKQTCHNCFYRAYNLSLSKAGLPVSMSLKCTCTSRLGSITDPHKASTCPDFFANGLFAEDVAVRWKGVESGAKAAANIMRDFMGVVADTTVNALRGIFDDK